MGGTRVGGQKAAQATLAKYGSDFYSRIGVIGGKKGRTGGFYGNPKLAAKLGKVGGHNGLGKHKRQPNRQAERQHLDSVSDVV